MSSVVTFSDQQKARRAIWNKKSCLHPNSSECKGAIVRAHSVQKSMLRRISHNSKVYAPAVEQFPNKPPKIDFKLTGIGDASIFTGFCGLHDNETFAPIETKEFTGTAEQCFLYGYRAISKEFFLKRAHRADVRYSLSMPDINYYGKMFLRTSLLGVNAGVKELDDLKRAFDAMLISQQFEDLRYCIFWLDRTPSMLCNSFFQLDYDFNGNELQDCTDLNRRLDALSLTILATGEAGAVVLVWHKESNASCLELIQSLLTFPEHRQPDLLVNWAVKEAENIYFAPAWWESLDPVNQEIVTEEFQDNPSLLKVRSPFYISEGRIEATEWAIAGIETNAFSQL